MKRFITPLIAVLLFCASYATAQTVTFTVGSTTADRGQQICLPVKVSGFNQILGFQLSISYDPSSLQFASLKNLNLPDLTEASSFGLPGSGNVPQGKITVLWDEKTFAGLTRADETTIFEVCFNVLNTANSTKVEFSNTPTPPDVFNASGASLTFNGQAGNVTVNGSGGGGTTPFKVIASNKTVTQGMQVCVDISAEGFKDVNSLQFTMQFDPTKLQFTSVGSFNLNGLSNSSFGLPGTGGVPAGRITLSWDDPAGQGITLQDGTILFQACFTAIASGSTTLSFTNSPLQPEVINGDQQELTFSSQNGTITINSNGSGGGGNSDVFKLSIADTTSASGTTVCLNTSAQGYNDILFMQFSLQYDTTKLQFVSVGNFNLTGLDLNSFGVPGSGAVPKGRITVSWSDPGVQGVTIPDGTNIFQVCFKILMTSGSSSVGFVASPTPIEIVNGDSQFVTFSSKNGTVTVGNGGGGTGQLKFSISDKTVQSGQQVCVDVTVDNMNDIIGITLGVQYDPAKLQFVSVGQFGLPDLTAAQFGTPTSSPPTTAGLVTMVWFDNAVAGVDRANGSVIFQLCFNAIGASGTTATVSFTGTPTAPMGVDNIDEEAEPFTTKNGTVTIGSGSCTLSLAVPVITSVNCFGQSTGAINITPQGCSGNYTYKWSNNATSQDLTNIPAGTYSVTVTDPSTNSTVSATYNVTQPAVALTATSSITNIACGASANSGAINLTVSGGTSPYSYRWSNNATTQNLTNLTAGTYAVTITDNRTCTFALSNLNVTSLSTVQVSNIVPTNIGQQGNNGAVAITVTGGTGNLTYSWAGPNNYTSTQKDISGLSTPGQYCVTVTDAMGCTANRCAMVNSPMVVTLQATRICDGASNGAITLTVTGGISPYSYKWSNGATTQNLNNVAAGNYTVTITDSQGGMNTSTTEVTKYPPIVLNAQITPATGTASNGKIILTTTGGTSPYTFKWNNNSTKDTLANVVKGEYCVTVTDSKGCTSNSCYTVPEQPDVPLSIANRQFTGVTCSGNSDGALSFEIKGGRSPYTVTFSDNSTLPISNGLVNKNNLSGGKLVYTITDGAGTILKDSVDIPIPAPITMNSVVKHDNEEAGCTGTINVTFQGGKAPYTVSWNTPNTGSAMQIVNLCEGNFIATVEDANGCKQTFPAIPVTTFRASGSSIATACPQDTNGMVILTINGGAKPYAYSWKNAAGSVLATTDTLKNVPPGVYTVSVTEQSGNTLVKQFTVGSNSNLNADVEIISDYNGSDISCSNATDAILEAVGKSGSGNYSYEWKKETAVLATTPVLNGVGVGTYQVSVKDGLGCTVVKQLIVAAPDTLQILGNIREISCLGDRNGEIIASALGGASSKPYSFVWSNGTNGPRISFLVPGTYQVTATDANNCKTSTTFVLAEPKNIQVKVQTQPATDGCNGSALAVVEGGTAPYTYKWNAPASVDAMIGNLCEGSYTVLVTDSRGCAASSATGIVSEAGNPDCLVEKIIITPEGDGVNDMFRIDCNDAANNHLEVYNRWGQLVFQADNYQTGWGGTTQSGDPLPEGPYYFVLEFTNGNGELVQQKGSLTILRGK